MRKSYIQRLTALQSFAFAVVFIIFFTASPSYGHDISEEPIGTALQVYDGLLTPDLAVSTFRATDRLFATREIAIGAKPYELQKAAKQLEQVKFKSNGKDYDLFDYLSLNRVSGVMVLKDGKVAYELYQYGNTRETRWMSMSMAKSFTSTLMGAAVQDGLVNLKDRVTKYVPSLKGSAYEGVTVRDILMFASGVYWSEESGEAAGKMNPKTPRRQLLDIQIAQKPGAVMKLMSTLPRVAPIGSVMEYSSGEAQVQVEVLRAVIKKPLSTYLSEKIWANFGMEFPAFWWLDSPGGSEIGGSGMSATLSDYARFGLFIMNNGVVGNKRVLPEGWVADAGSAKISSVSGQPNNYGYNWWVPSRGPSRDDGAFEARGKGGQGIYINQKNKIVIAITSAQIKGNAPIDNGDFYDAVVAALK